MTYVFKAAAVLCLLAAGGAVAQTTTAPVTTSRPMGTTPPIGSTTPMASPAPTAAPMTSGSSMTTSTPMTTPATSSPANGPAAVTGVTSSRTAQTPAAGANSFTEGQARSRITDHGFTNVTDLKKDAQGIWRGMAQKGGKSVAVALDFEGNVQSR